MLKIWTKVIKDDKIIKNILYNIENKYKPENLDKYLRDICDKLDIPTPVLLKSHKKHFNNLNFAKFIRDDFVETVDFDFMTLEFVKEVK